VSRGRPRGFDTDATLDRAMEVFWRNGYRATTTRDLESALGVTQSSLYNAFGSKAELAELALVRYRDRVGRALLAPLRDGADGLADLERFFADLERWQLADGTRGCLIGRLMGEGAGEEPRVAAHVRAYRAELLAALEAALERAAAAGEIAPGAARDRAEILVAVAFGMNLAIQAGFGPEVVRRHAAAARAEIRSWRLAPGMERALS